MLAVAPVDASDNLGNHDDQEDSTIETDPVGIIDRTSLRWPYECLWRRFTRSRTDFHRHLFRPLPAASSQQTIHQCTHPERMPLVPVLRLYNDVKRKYEDDAMENLDDLSGLDF